MCRTFAVTPVCRRKEEARGWDKSRFPSNQIFLSGCRRQIRCSFRWIVIIACDANTQEEISGDFLGSKMMARLFLVLLSALENVWSIFLVFLVDELPMKENSFILPFFKVSFRKLKGQITWHQYSRGFGCCCLFAGNKWLVCVHKCWRKSSDFSPYRCVVVMCSEHIVFYIDLSASVWSSDNQNLNFSVW